MDDVTLPGALMQQIGAYLVERPYREVAHIVDGIRAAISKAATDADAAVPPVAAPSCLGNPA